MTREQALNCMPVHNSDLTWELLPDDLVRIEYTLNFNPFFQSILNRFSPEQANQPTRKLELDALGSRVWTMIDGKTTTADIIRAFAKHQPITQQESEQSVTLFLRQLGKRGLVGLR